MATLPPPTEILPREKPIPKAKPLTKWESYAKEKGIQKQKKSKLVWDDVVKEWVPRFGYKKAKAEVEKNWLMPYKVMILQTYNFRLLKSLQNLHDLQHAVLEVGD